MEPTERGGRNLQRHCCIHDQQLLIEQSTAPCVLMPSSRRLAFSVGYWPLHARTVKRSLGERNHHEGTLSLPLHTTALQNITRSVTRLPSRRLSGQSPVGCFALGADAVRLHIGGSLVEQNTIDAPALRI